MWVVQSLRIWGDEIREAQKNITSFHVKGVHLPSPLQPFAGVKVFIESGGEVLNYLFRQANNYRVYGILKKIFSQKSLSKNGMTLRNPKKNLRKESWFKWYNQMA